MTIPESCATPLPGTQRLPLRELFAAVGNLYCRLFHKSISRPVGGRYRCWKCLRDFELDW